MALLNTDNPYALRFLLDDTIYAFDTSAEELMDDVITTSAQQVSFNYLGSNNKNILYLVEHPTDAYFSPAAYEAFSKTILALGLSFDDIAVFNLSCITEETTFETLQHFFKATKVILAGPKPQKIGLTELSLNTSIQLEQVKVLYTYSFEEMLNDVNKKKVFWQAVKAL